MKHVTFSINSEVADNSVTVINYMPKTFMLGDIPFTKINLGLEPQAYCDRFIRPDISITTRFTEIPKKNVVKDEFCDSTALELYRHSKTAGTVVINELGYNHCETFAPLELYSDVFNFTPNPDKQYLLRHKSGARGLGFMTVDPKGKSICSIDAAIMTGYAKHGNNQSKFFEHLQDNGVVFTKEGMWPDENMIVTFFTNGLKNCDVIEYVPGNQIAAEYRIMTDYTGAPALVIPRKRLETALAFDVNGVINKVFMAKGSDQDQSVAVPYNEAGLPVDIDRFFSAGFFPVMSFDLFVKNDRTWGFFEFSTEFGFTSLPNGWVAEQAKQLVRSLYKEPRSWRPGFAAD